MLESRWGRRAGPLVGSAAVLLAIVGTTLGAADVPDRPPPDCSGRPGPDAAGAAWSTLDARLDDGTLVGQVARVGAVGGDAWTIDLPPESFVSEPRDGRLVLGADDGRASELRLVDTAAGCASPIGTERDVVRGAVLAPDGRGIYEHRVRRSDRADLGVWYRDITAGRTRRVLAAPAVDARFGRTWSTDLLWSDDGRALAVVTCGEVACRVRLLEPGSGRVRSIDDPRVGAVVGLTADRVLARGACPGMPCSILAIDVASGRHDVVVPSAGAAAMTATADGRPVLAHVETSAPAAIRFLALDGGAAPATVTTMEIVAPLVRGGGTSAELPPGWLVVGAAGPQGPGARRAFAIEDGSTRDIDEVQP